MKKIKLTQNKFALVDDEDFEYINQWKWCYKPEKRGSSYAHRGVNLGNGKYKSIIMHRLILKVPKGLQVDHINHDGIDNRKENLRVCTNSDNSQNRSKQKTVRGREVTSKYKGVSLSQYKDNKKWRAQLRYKGKYVYIGLYKTEKEAALAYNKMALKKFGKFANINII